jgi:hypothetical protein
LTDQVRQIPAHKTSPPGNYTSRDKLHGSKVEEMTPVQQAIGRLAYLWSTQADPMTASCSGAYEGICYRPPWKTTAMGRVAEQGLNGDTYSGKSNAQRRRARQWGSWASYGRTVPEPGARSKQGVPQEGTAAGQPPLYVDIEHAITVDGNARVRSSG